MVVILLPSKVVDGACRLPVRVFLIVRRRQTSRLWSHLLYFCVSVAEHIYFVTYDRCWYPGRRYGQIQDAQANRKLHDGSVEGPNVARITHTKLVQLKDEGNKDTSAKTKKKKKERIKQNEIRHKNLLLMNNEKQKTSNNDNGETESENNAKLTPPRRREF